MNKRLLTLSVFCALALIAVAQRTRTSFDQGWQFAYGHASDPSKDFGCGTEYFNYLTKANSIHNAGPYALKFVEGAEWRPVDLPFDWVVDLPFGKDASYSHGFKQVGWKYPATSVGWYRKTFRMPESARGRHVRLQFDGIYRNAQVWVNGFYLGTEPSGYKQQDYDITDYLRFGEGDDNLNLVCVRCDASLEEGWYYEGAGIYRHAWLQTSSPLHVATGGVFAYSRLSDNYKKAGVTIETEVVNDANDNGAAYQVRHRLVAPDGTVVARTSAEGMALKPRARHTNVSVCELENPLLWNVDSPHLYSLVTEVSVGGQVVDSLSTRIGIREITMDADKGLFVNGRPVKLKGVNCHQDHAGVGTGLPDGLQRYRMQRLKWMGVNAYRASHNPMTPELLDICDELGILVFEENRLMGINENQISVLQDMIRNHRNHPSVFLWGVGNEEWGIEWDDRGTVIAETMARYAHLADSTRPVGVASSGGPHILKNVDVAGYNYLRQHPIDRHRKDYPKRLALGSEETSGCGTRGIYFPQPKESGRMLALNLNPEMKDSVDFAVERGWKFYVERPWLMGLFFWTGFDYRGEPVPMNYPATGSFFGLLDYCGFPKDEAYYLKSWWTEEPMVHIMPHWNLEGHEGEEITTYVFSNCEEVELIVNGRKMGRKPMPKNGHLEWTVTYQPGAIQAIGYSGGKRMAAERLETAGEPARIEQEIHRYEDVGIVDLSVLDRKKRFVPTACVPVTVTVEGDATILGYGNGDSAYTDAERPTDRSARTVRLKTFNGRAQVIVKSVGGNFKIATSLNTSLR